MATLGNDQQIADRAYYQIADGCNGVPNNEMIKHDQKTSKMTMPVAKIFPGSLKQKTFGLSFIFDKFRFRYIPALFMFFVVSQVLIFGVVIPRNCNYFMWLVGQCTRTGGLLSSSQSVLRMASLKSKPLCPLIPPALGECSFSIVFWRIFSKINYSYPIKNVF